MNIKRLPLTAYAVRLLLGGKPGEAIVAELRDWNGPRRSTYMLAATLVVVAVLSLTLSAAGELGFEFATTELARLPFAR